MLLRSHYFYFLVQQRSEIFREHPIFAMPLHYRKTVRKNQVRKNLAKQMIVMK